MKKSFDEFLELESICKSLVGFISDSNVYRDNDRFEVIIEYHNGAVSSFNGSYDECITWLQVLGLVN